MKRNREKAKTPPRSEARRKGDTKAPAKFSSDEKQAVARWNTRWKKLENAILQGKVVLHAKLVDLKDARYR